jgi:hypothetical protein
MESDETDEPQFPELEEDAHIDAPIVTEEWMLNYRAAIPIGWLADKIETRTLHKMLNYEEYKKHIRRHFAQKANRNRGPEDL